MKRRIALLLVLTALFLAAPNAMAVCYRCTLDTRTCFVAGPFGYQICDDTYPGECWVQDPCNSALSEKEELPLASEFTVAAVERLDGPNAARSATLVASMDAAPAER